MRKREYYNNVARRSAYIARFAEIMRFRAKAHRWFTRSAIPWWLALLCSGCAADVLGGAKSDCDRYADAMQAAADRCPSDAWHIAEHCSTTVYTSDGDKVEQCITFLQSATCEQIKADTTCNHIEWIHL